MFGKSPQGHDTNVWPLDQLDEQIRQSLETLLRSICDSQGNISPTDAVDSLSNYTMTTTKRSREFMENNVNQTLPLDWVAYPGKLDHSTCICFRLGRWLEWKYQRILWLGWLDRDCILAMLPRDILRQIITACFY
eukprot:TRINITY_DN8987_c0_g1_i1.p3 TRINITY_DN8987_c0_g1~~TRINITY_DN8987_c0_g1_i1.p3  ORF type:complete len:135 (-),score=21.14 TRINITY_DN8987_c0_g1_i1:15-419(-)